MSAHSSNHSAAVRSTSSRTSTIFMEIALALRVLHTASNLTRPMTLRHGEPCYAWFYRYPNQHSTGNMKDSYTIQRMLRNAQHQVGVDDHTLSTTQKPTNTFSGPTRVDTLLLLQPHLQGLLPLQTRLLPSIRPLRALLLLTSPSRTLTERDTLYSRH